MNHERTNSSTPRAHVAAVVLTALALAAGAAMGATAALLLMVPAGALALIRMARGRLQPFQHSLLVDGAILALGATALFAVAFDIVLTAIGHDPGPVIVAYPVGAISLLGFGAWIALLTGRRPDRALGTALTGLALAAATGLAFAVLRSLESSSPEVLLGAGWFIGALLVGMAVLQEARPVHVALDGPSRLTTTTVAAVCALAVLVSSAVVFSIRSPQQWQPARSSR